MKKVLLSIVLCTFAMILAACGGQSANQENQENSADTVEHNEAHDSTKIEVLGDIRETTDAIEILPTFLNGLHEDIVYIYEDVPHHQELLEHIPCYCGCEPFGHQHVYNCYIHENKEDGTVVWDDHGTKCGVCLEIAYVSMKYADEGYSPTEIREVIDQAYREGYADPTPTPKPAE
ncbi:PCYCGC motif-containing (lipo)protein [Anaerobacillus sp. MEB173]|uniref:PCYCGC motif-containing (lipo)protein n=1 Tax=Anaerobacillus sp. MEB173 TaxID=3383345 RepID=UPI003F8DB6DC